MSENGDAHVSTDQWTEQLRCPQCRRTGMVNLYQGRNDDTPTVDDLPEGFKIVITEYGPGFRCATCDVAAEP